MATRKEWRELEIELGAMLGERFEGISVDVAHSSRWDRMCVKFRWQGFTGLLPEERFRRLTEAIPDEFRETHLAGYVWLELAPSESVEAFLKLPRSEDVIDKEPKIYAGLVKAGFFESLSESMGSAPDKSCGGGFSQVESVLSAKDFSEAKIRDAKLAFIRHRAYCDCQVLLTAREELDKLHAEV